MFGSEMKNVLVRRIGEESASRTAMTQAAFVEGNSVQPSDEFTDLQAPMRVQVVDDPMEAPLLGKMRGDALQVVGKILAGPREAQVPNNLARGNDEGADQGARAVADVVILAFLGLSGLREDGRVLSLKDLHAGLFVAADRQFALLIQ